MCARGSRLVWRRLKTGAVGQALPAVARDPGGLIPRARGRGRKNDSSTVVNPDTVGTVAWMASADLGRREERDMGRLRWAWVTAAAAAGFLVSIPCGLSAQPASGFWELTASRQESFPTCPEAKRQVNAAHSGQPLVRGWRRQPDHQDVRPRRVGSLDRHSRGDGHLATASEAPGARESRQHDPRHLIRIPGHPCLLGMNRVRHRRWTSPGPELRRGMERWRRFPHREHADRGPSRIGQRHEHLERAAAQPDAPGFPDQGLRKGRWPDDELAVRLHVAGCYRAGVRRVGRGRQHEEGTTPASSAAHAAPQE